LRLTGFGAAVGAAVGGTAVGATVGGTAVGTAVAGAAVAAGGTGVGCGAQAPTIEIIMIDVKTKVKSFFIKVSPLSLDY